MTTTTTTMEELEVSTSEGFLDMYDDSPLGGRVIVVASSNSKATMNFESCEDKAQDIRECLQLHSESHSDTVDLWELRQLAISPGGLLSPSLRQVAWPLLTGLSMPDEACTTKSTSVDEPLAELMQQDIEKTIWNLEELVRQSQSGKDSFWYAPLLQSSGNAALDAEAPAMVLSSPCSSSETSHAESQTTTTNSPVKGGKPCVVGPQDQILLTKVLTKAVQGQTNYPVVGISNLASLFMINLESTSLASLLISQLATYPLKAAFGGASLESLQSMMHCLLAKFPPKTKVDIPAKVEEALAWFSGPQTSNLQAASRLMDAFLVSHPLFPLYVGTAAASEAETSASWNMEMVEQLISKALEYMEQMPPAQLTKSTNAATVLPSTPNWAIAATATADWAPTAQSIGIIGNPSTSTEQRVVPFSDEESSSEWERLSTASQVESDDHNTTSAVVPTKETLFHESYPLAMTAAGLGLSSNKSRSLKFSSAPEGSFTGSRRYLKMVFVVTAIVAVLVAAWSQPCSTVAPPSMATPAPHPLVQRFVPPTGAVPRARERPYEEKFLGILPVERPAPKKVLRTMGSSRSSKYVQAPSAVPIKVEQEAVVAPPKAAPSSPPRMMSKPQKQRLVPASPQAKLSVMVSNDQAKTTTANETTSAMPELEQLLQRYIMSGFQTVEDYYDTLHQSWSASPAEALAKPVTKKFQPLRPIKMQLSKVSKQVGKLWSKVVTFVRRRDRKNAQYSKSE